MDSCSGSTLASTPTNCSELVTPRLFTEMFNAWSWQVHYMESYVGNTLTSTPAYYTEVLTTRIITMTSVACHQHAWSTEYCSYNALTITPAYPTEGVASRTDPDCARRVKIGDRTQWISECHTTWTLRDCSHYRLELNSNSRKKASKKQEFVTIFVGELNEIQRRQSASNSFNLAALAQQIWPRLYFFYHIGMIRNWLPSTDNFPQVYAVPIILYSNEVACFLPSNFSCLCSFDRLANVILSNRLIVTVGWNLAEWSLWVLLPLTFSLL